MDQVEKAADYFSKGYNCSQAVLAACGKPYGIDEQTALRVACGFGAGCGRTGQTCGAVTGAYMVIGMKHGKVRQDDNAAKETTYALVQEFTKRFIARNRSVNCVDLLGCHLGTPEGMAKAHRDNLIAMICPNMVREAAEILDDVLTGA